jgi:hypothetical protein
MYVLTSSAKLRSGESPLEPVLAVLPKGTEVEVLRRKGRFARVKTKDKQEGWLYLRRLTDQKPEQSGGDIFSTLGQSFRSLRPSKTAASSGARGVEEADGTGGRSTRGRSIGFTPSMEKYRPTEGQLDRFLREGKLGEYAE